MKSLVFVLILFLHCAFGQRRYNGTVAGPYLPTWDSLDSRPLPAWYDDSKIGIFLHWGVFSVPSYRSEWFWWNWQGDAPVADYAQFVKDNYRPGWTYPDFASQFTAEFFDPAKWAQLFKRAGAKYVVLTSKHHEGFTMWPSNNSFNWNAGAIGPKRDLVGDLATAVRASGLHFGLYHSLFEWFNPLYLSDKASGYKEQLFVDRKSLPELYDIVNRYKPDVIWSDGDWDGPAEYWKSQEFLAWLYNDSPVIDSVVVNDRWGYGVMCNHGGFLTCADRYNPGHLMNKKWENAMTLDQGTWGYSRVSELTDYLSLRDLLMQLSSTVAYGGNLLINVGPTHDGRIVPIFEERLTQMGEWLDINKVSIYSTQPWGKAQNDSITPNVYYTQSLKTSNVYATFFDWPRDHVLTLGCVTPTANIGISVLGGSSNLKWAVGPTNQLFVNLDAYPIGSHTAWVLEFTGLSQYPMTYYSLSRLDFVFHLKQELFSIDK